MKTFSALRLEVSLFSHTTILACIPHKKKKKKYKNSTFTKHVQTFFGILKYKRKDHLSNSSLKNVKSHLKHPGSTFYCYKTIDVVSFCQSVVVLLLHSPFSEDSPTKNPFPSYFLVLYHTHLPPKGYFLIYGWVGHRFKILVQLEFQVYYQGLSFIGCGYKMFIYQFWRKSVLKYVCSSCRH